MKRRAARTAEQSVGLRLLAWAVFSTIAGTTLIALPLGPLSAGVGLQAIVWGIVDAAIAVLGLRRHERTGGRTEEHLAEHPAADQTAERTRGSARERVDERVEAHPEGNLPAATDPARLIHLLRINSALDILYIAGGALLMWFTPSDSPFLFGNGLGIVIQGAFLFIFDLLSSVALARSTPAP